MNLKDYVKNINDIDINEVKVQEIESIYNFKSNNLLFSKLISSLNDDCTFLEEEQRVLSYDEVLNASEELHVDFKTLHLVPVIDTYENNFICFNYDKNIWVKMNINDLTIFLEKNNLDDYSI